MVLITVLTASSTLAKGQTPEAEGALRELAAVLSGARLELARR